MVSTAVESTRYTSDYCYHSVERLHQIAIDGNHGAVTSCDVAGPYGVLLLQEGVGLLRLHEEQSEQLMEAGMSMDDEQSFSANDDAGSILTLDWPKLDQQVSNHGNYWVVEDMIQIVRLQELLASHCTRIPVEHSV